MDDLASSRDRDHAAAADRFGEHAGHNLDAEAAAAAAAAPSGMPQPARVSPPPSGLPPTTAQAPAWQQAAGAGTPPLPTAQAAPPPRLAPAAANAPDPWLDVDMEVRLHFGGREMLLSEALEIGPGTVLELDRHVDDPVDLLVGDRIVARGEVVILGGNFALQISEVLAPLPRLESVRCLL